MSDSSDPMHCSLPGPSVHGIFQAKVLEWGAIAFSIILAKRCKEKDHFLHTDHESVNSVESHSETWIFIVKGRRIFNQILDYYAPSCVRAQSLQSCPILCDPMDCSLSGSSVHGILQARTLEWVAISFSNA